NKRTAIAKGKSGQKQVGLVNEKRHLELLSLERQTLDSENERRIATSQKPFPNWESFQASLDALAESRSKMEAN
ncbi:tail-specific protease, partial [Acinetobacter baumannii]